MREIRCNWSVFGCIWRMFHLRQDLRQTAWPYGGVRMTSLGVTRTRTGADARALRAYLAEKTPGRLKMSPCPVVFSLTRN